jgi:hypothetical protein
VIVGGVKLRWAPKLRPEKLRRLYETDARGIVDDELIDDVGYTLYSRCGSILTVTEAFHGRVKCPGCAAVLLRGDPGRGPAEELLHCAACGWQTTWKEYHRSWQNRQLWGGNAVEAFEAFVRRFPATRTPREKMLLIDQLIHAYHYDLKRQSYNRPAAANLIEGGMKQVVQFLDSLTYGADSTSGLEEIQAAWRENLAASGGGVSRSELKRQQRGPRGAAAAKGDIA